jgi:hypothetical protein
MYLLTSFIKAWYGHDNKIKWTRIKCRLWFGTTEEMDAFVAANTEIQGYVPNPFDPDNSEKWPDYYTKEMTFSK